MVRKHEYHRHELLAVSQWWSTPRDLIPGGYFYPRVRLPPGGYYYTTGVRVPPGTSILGYDYPPKEVRGVLLHYRCTITPRYFYPARVRLPLIHRGYFYPARAGLHPGTSTLPGQDYPPVLIPCQGTFTPHTQGGTSTLLG